MALVAKDRCEDSFINVHLAGFEQYLVEGKCSVITSAYCPQACDMFSRGMENGSAEWSSGECTRWKTLGGGETKGPQLYPHPQ